MLPALRVLEDLIGRGDVLELSLRGRVGRVHIRMELARKAAVCLLDLGLARLAIDTEKLIGRGDVLELSLRGRVGRVHIRMELARKAAVCLLDLGLARLAIDTENLV